MRGDRSASYASVLVAGLWACSLGGPGLDGGIPEGKTDGGGPDGASPDGASPDGGGPDASTDGQNFTIRIGSLPGTLPFDRGSPGSTHVALDVNEHVVIAPSPARNLWIAIPAQGTVSKVDPGTGKQVARYCTAPGCGAQPTSIAVPPSRRGIAVLNQSPSSPSVVYLAGDKTGCVDRNGNGMIDTYEGEGLVPAAYAWPVGSAQSPDECVVWKTDLTKDRKGVSVSGGGTAPRSLTFVESKKGERLYIGLSGTAELVELRVDSGQVDQHVAFPGRPFGATVDATRPLLWVSDASSRRVVGVEVAIPGLPGRPVGSENPCPGTLAVDLKGLVYSAGGDCLARMDPSEGSPSWTTFQIPGSALSGLVVDDASTLWASDGAGGGYKVTNASATPAFTPVGTTSTPYLGAALDEAGRPWFLSATTPTCSSSGAVDIHGVDSTTGQTTSSYPTAVGGSAIVGRSEPGTRRGVYVQRLAAQGCSGPSWKDVKWDLTTPPGTRVFVGYRVANDAQALASARLSTLSASQALDLRVAGMFLELVFLLESDVQGVSPAIREITATYACPASCRNQSKDEGEQAVDCGGQCARCTACSSDETCNPGAACVSSQCSATCDDLKLTGDESDVDCGGTCPNACKGGQRCLRASDCESGACGSDGMCKAVCFGVACGADGRGCDSGGDCTSGLCSGGICVPSTCGNNVQDASETDVDCGGLSCRPCADAKSCVANSDCSSRTCVANQCLPPPCARGAGNCELGDSCESASDCRSARCVAGVCRGCQIPALDAGASDSASDAFAESGGGVDATLDGGIDATLDGHADGGSCTGPLTLQAQTINLVPDDSDVALGDFNGDTFLDAVIPGRVTHVVSLVLGNGDGTFQAPTTFSTGVNPQGIAVGDLNGDGKLDVVTPSTSPAVNVLLGNGNGTFQPKTPYATGSGTNSVALADLNGDGKLDVLAGNYTDNSVSVLLGNGDGTLQAKVDYAAGGGSPGVAKVAAGKLRRLDASANVDVVVLNATNNTVGVLLGNGNGTLGSVATYATDATPTGVTLGDINGDGAMDLVVSCASGAVNPSIVNVFLGNGDGTFLPRTSVTTGRFPYSPVLFDMDGDGKLDIVVASSGDSAVSLNRGMGDGTFAAVESISNGAGTFPQAIAVGNLNGGGRPDVFVVTVGDTANVLLGCP